jgi:hypothetical protein
MNIGELKTLKSKSDVPEEVSVGVTLEQSVEQHPGSHAY